jgi:NitT/TauT family transport system substrate-binding protein
MNDMQQIRRKSILYPLVVLILAFILVSCQPGQQAVKIGTNDWIGYSPFVLAEKAGLFSKNEADAELVNFASAQQEIEALREGDINGAALTFDEVVTLVDNGFPLKVVLVLDFSLGGDMVLGQPEITTMEQLKGKKAGYEGSVVGEFLLSHALIQNGLKKSEIELENIPTEEWATSFKSQKVDALVCFNPVASQLVNDRQANILFNSAEIPYQIIDVLAFSEPFYNSNQPAIKKVIQSWFDALALQKTDSLQAMEIISLEKNINTADYTLSIQGLEEPGFASNLALFRPESEQNIYKYAQPVINFMQSEGLISERINTANLFPHDVLESMAKDKKNQKDE